MKFESLPNEIFLDLFEYFYGIDLLDKFYGLNSRFNCLLYKQFRFYCLDFTSISKHNFDMLCQQHLPFIANRVIELRLCGYNNTPEQINFFVSYVPSYWQFTGLRFLMLSNLYSYQTLLKLFDKCQHFNSLTHLNVYSCSFPNDEANFQLIVNNIWSLPKLIQCAIGIEGQTIFCVPTITSSTLQYLSIYGSKLEMNDINQLFVHTPCLRHLYASVKSIVNDDYIVSPLPRLIKFKVIFSLEFVTSKVNVIFQSMSNLCHLSILMWFELIDGHQWKQIISNYLPKLKTFQLNMNRILPFEANIQERAKRLFDSFQSPFWIDEHQWFVRCFTQIDTIHLHTLSNAFPYNPVMFPDFWQSTYPNDNQQDFYNKMTIVSDETLFNRPISSDIRLFNIENLCIKLPINEQFWSIVSSLNKLNTLEVSSYTDVFQSQLQTLLDRAPHLHELSISQDASLSMQMLLFSCSNESVRKLDLSRYEYDFNEDECLTLSHSSLGVQCEELYISVDSCESIIILVKNMLNLRSLSVECAEEEYYKQSALAKHSDNKLHNEENLINDELIQWLKDRLPTKYMIVRDPEAHYLILIRI